VGIYSLNREINNRSPHPTHLAIITKDVLSTFKSKRNIIINTVIVLILKIIKYTKIISQYETVIRVLLYYCQINISKNSEWTQ